MGLKFSCTVLGFGVEMHTLRQTFQIIIYNRLLLSISKWEISERARFSSCIVYSPRLLGTYSANIWISCFLINSALLTLRQLWNIWAWLYLHLLRKILEMHLTLHVNTQTHSYTCNYLVAFMQVALRCDYYTANLPNWQRSKLPAAGSRQRILIEFNECILESAHSWRRPFLPPSRWLFIVAVFTY